MLSLKSIFTSKEVHFFKGNKHKKDINLKFDIGHLKLVIVF